MTYYIVVLINSYFGVGLPFALPGPVFSLTHSFVHRQGEIDAREDSFRSTIESGQMLLDSNHESATEIQEKLEVLSEEKVQLLELWEERRVLYEQCMDLQLFYRDTEQADTWMAKQEVTELLMRDWLSVL